LATLHEVFIARGSHYIVIAFGNTYKTSATEKPIHNNNINQVSQLRLATLARREDTMTA